VALPLLDSKVSDYHFYEVFIKIKNNTPINLDDVKLKISASQNLGFFAVAAIGLV